MTWQTSFLVSLASCLLLVGSSVGINATLHKDIDRASYCSRNPCVRVYCVPDSTVYRWSCQTSKKIARTKVCDYFTMTEEDFYSASALEQNDSAHSLHLPWCGDSSPPKNRVYKYVGYYKYSRCPSAWPITTKEYNFAHWKECD